MKLVLPICIFVFSLTALADRFQSKIHSIDVSTKQGMPHLILLENARVVFVKSNDWKVLNSFRESLRRQQTLEIEVNDKNDYLSAETVEDPEALIREGEEVPEVRMSYDPDVVSDSSATSIFKRMRRDYQNNSQCYNRAHIWAYEEFKKTSLKSMKLFLFFTSRYIRNYRYKWWFHVSPMVAGSGGDRVLDRRYTSGPRYKDHWTKSFIYSGRKCPVINKYYDYRNNQDKEDCYLIPVSMYFWQPRDIEHQDRTGFEKTSFIMSEVNHAYWEAF